MKTNISTPEQKNSRKEEKPETHRKSNSYLCLSIPNPKSNLISEHEEYNIEIQFLKAYLTEYKLPDPSLIISVIGANTNFKLESWKQEKINLDLINALKPFAWIMTSGSDKSVINTVKNAMKDKQTSNLWSQDENVFCIGITPFKDFKNGKWQNVEDACTYNSVKNSIINRIESTLPISSNPNYTHFILINNKDEECNFGNFETIVLNYLSKTSKVLILLEGDRNALEKLKLYENIPFIVYNGTRKLVDIIACYFNLKKENSGKLRKKVKNLINNLIIEFPDLFKEQNFNVDKYYDMIEKNLKDLKNQITIFNIDDEEELDLSILNILLQDDKISTHEQKNSDSKEAINADAKTKPKEEENLKPIKPEEQRNSNSKLQKKLNLAYEWKQCGIAQDLIMDHLNNSDECIEEKYLENMTMKMMLDNNIDFVRLFFQKEVIKINNIFSINNLLEIYTKTKPNVFDHFMKKTKYSLVEVHNIVSNFIGIACGNNQPVKNTKQDEEIDVYKELFLWAILMNRHEMAKFFWEFAEHPVATALIGGWLNGAMADNLSYSESDLYTNLTNNKIEFEKLALNVLEQCYDKDQLKASKIIKLKNKKWGKLCCLEIAANANNKSFLSSICCQKYIEKQWKRCILSSEYMILFAILFPPLISRIDFGKDSYASNKVVPSNNESDKNNNKKKKRIDICCYKFSTFYSAPVTKFFGNLIFYLLFMFMYSWTLLFEFERGAPSYHESVINFWIFSLFLDEIREIVSASSRSNLRDKIKDWWNFSYFNRIDFSMFVIGFFGFISRFSIKLHFITIALYSINCCIIYIRFLRFYYLSSDLGPKIIMIYKMLKELCLFLCIYIVILLTYGVTTQSLLKQNRDFYTLIFKDILYDAYWQLFGRVTIDTYNSEIDKLNEKNLNCTWLNDSDLNSCSDSTWLLHVFTAVYLLITNILLINILIANFNNVYEEVDKNSIEFWKQGIYFLEAEFENKPYLPPPFIVIEHIIRFVLYVINFLNTAPDDEEKKDTEEDLLIAMQMEYRKNVKVTLNPDNDNLIKKVLSIESKINEMARNMKRDRGKFSTSKSQRKSALNVGKSALDVVEDKTVTQLHTKTNGETE